jgi:hypothetical protein
VAVQRPHNTASVAMLDQPAGCDQPVVAACACCSGHAAGVVVTLDDHGGRGREQATIEMLQQVGIEPARRAGQQVEQVSGEMTE